jgi:hypothetical protein
MSRMTLKEKIGQLNMPCVYVNQLGRDIPTKAEVCKKYAEGTYTDEIGPGGGFFTLANTILKEGTRQQADYFNQLQGIALNNTRLKIPLLQTEEGSHGAMFPGATVFQEGLTLGSTFDGPREVHLLRGRSRGTFRGNPRTMHAGGGAELVAERFLVGRGYLNEPANNPASCDLPRAMGTPFDDMEFARMKKLVDEVAADRRWIIFVGHEIDPRYYQKTRFLILLYPCVNI